jgi:hypothetical protein
MLAMAVAAWVAACAGGAPQPGTPAPAVAEPVAADLASVYRTLAAQGQGRVFRLDPAASAVRIYVFRAGAAAKAGHNHVLTAADFEGYAFLPDAGPAHGRFDLRFPLDKLAIDDPSVRGATGGAFAGTIAAADIDGTRRHMLGERNLDADRFPDLQIHSAAIAGELPYLAATVGVRLHGVARELPVPLHAVVDGDTLHVGGAFVLRQTDFAIKPYSVLGGLLAVEDAVVVEFELVGSRLEL